MRDSMTSKRQITRWTIANHFFFLWSLTVILISAATVFWPWGQQTYGGFYFAWDSGYRLYRPNDAFIEPSIHGPIQPHTYLLQINGIDVTPIGPAGVYEIYRTIAPTCDDLPATVNYLVTSPTGLVNREIPLFCRNLWHILPILLPVTPIALVIWLTGWAIAQSSLALLKKNNSHPNGQFGLLFSWVFVVTAAYIGKQAYNEVGFDTFVTRLVLFGAGLPIAACYTMSILAMTAALPPVSKSFQWVIKLLMLLTCFMLITAWLEADVRIPRHHLLVQILVTWHSRLALTMPLLSLFILFGRSIWISWNPNLAAYDRAPARGLVAAAQWLPFVTLTLVFYTGIERINNTLPPSQAWFIAAMSGYLLFVNIAILNAQLLPQATPWIRALTFGTLWSFAISLLFFLLLLKNTGQQIFWGSAFILALIIALRSPHRWQRWLERLTTYRTIRQEDIEQYTAALQHATTHRHLTHTIPTALNHALGTATAELHLPPHLPSPLPSQPQKMGEHWLLPLHYAEKETGLITLGPRPSSEPFHPADGESLQNIAYLTALALETAAQVGRARLDEQNIRLAERAELGHELHDTTLSNLHALMWTLDHLRQTLSQPTSAQQLLLQQAETQRREATQQLRYIVNNLAALDVTHQTCLQFIDSLFHEAQIHHPHIGFHLICPTPPDPFLSEPQKQAVLLVCKQAFDNALQHAQPHNITITLAYVPTQLTFAVADDGRGFTLPTADHSHNHHGLSNMHTRLFGVSGTLDVTTSPQGTTITGHIPLPNL